ncbi:MAG: hypothetical protein ACLGJC_10140 [Alphaproteobacteria bacterium]
MKCIEQQSDVSKLDTIGILMVPDFSMIAFTAAVEPLRLANHIGGKELYRWVLLSPNGGVQRASNGIGICVDHAIADAPTLSAVLVCSLYELFLETVVLPCRTGVFDYERDLPQRVRIGLLLQVRQDGARFSDDIGDVLSYDDQLPGASLPASRRLTVMADRWI